VGLVQRAIEAAGFTTLSLSFIWPFTASVSPPRIAAIERPGSQPLGPPGGADEQRAVLRASLEALARIDTPGQVRHLDFPWPEDRRVRLSPRPPPPITRAIKRRPWLFLSFLKRKFPTPVRRLD